MPTFIKTICVILVEGDKVRGGILLSSLFIYVYNFTSVYQDVAREHLVFLLVFFLRFCMEIERTLPFFPHGGTKSVHSAVPQPFPLQVTYIGV